MSNAIQNSQVGREIGQLYPELSYDEVREAECNLLGYLVVVRQIYQHVQGENPKILTKLRRRARLREKKAQR
jgi:hypothetical protein